MTDRNLLDPSVEIPSDAGEDREAQDHELAGEAPDREAQPGLYPADTIENTDGDNTPDAGSPAVDWDTRVQPERVDLTSRDGAEASPDIETEEH